MKMKNLKQPVDVSPVAVTVNPEDQTIFVAAGDAVLVYSPIGELLKVFGEMGPLHCIALDFTPAELLPHPKLITNTSAQIQRLATILTEQPTFATNDLKQMMEMRKVIYQLTKGDEESNLL